MKFSITLSGGVVLVAWALTGLVVPAPALAESLRVGIYQNEPKIFVDEAGQPAGFWVDILDHIAEAEDWSLTYVPCQWEACLRALEQGDLDLMMDVAYSEERDRLFDFNQEVVLPSWSVIYSRAGLNYDSILALDGQRVAVVKGSIQHATLREQTVSFGIAPVFVELDSFEDIFEQLEAGTVDAGVVNNFVGREAETEYTITKTNILVNPTRLHFVVAAGRSPTLLTDIDRHLRQLTSDGNSVYYRAKQQWLEPTRRQSLLSALRHAVLDGWVYIPVVGLAAFAVWNHRLSREVKRRQQAENRFQALADNTPGIIYQYVLRPDGTEAFLYISSRCRELWGVEAAAALEEARHLWERVHPDDLAQLRASVFRSARSLTPWQQEWRILTPTGQEKWLQASAQPQAQADGEVIWDGFVFDITARKTTEIALRKSESRFQRLADNVPGVLYGYRFRPDGTDEFTYISSGFTEVYGFPPDSALQDSAVVWRMTHPDDVERVRRSVMESYQTLRVWQAQYRVITPAGELKWLQGIARPTQEINGDVVWDGLIIDISDRKAAEAALSASDRRFRNMAANVPGAIFQYVLRADGTDNVNYMSPGCYDLWEISSAVAEQDAQQLWQLVHPDDRAAMLASVLHSAHTLEPWSWQWRIITPSGKTKWLEAGGRPERQDNGDVVWDSLIMDISDRKYAEVALRTSESRLTTLISNLPGFVYRVAPDPSRTADFISQGIHDLTGYPPEAYIDNRVTSLGQQTHPLDRDRVGNVIQRAIAQRRPYECEYRLCTRDGAVKWVWERGQGIFTDTGTLHHLEGFVTDVSDRKQAELALQASEVRYRKVVEAQTDFILRSLPDTTITFANPALCRAVGLTFEQIIGKQWLELANPDDLQREVFRQLASLTPDNPRCFVENRDTRANGQLGWTQWLNEGVFDEAGQLIEIQSVGRDITDLKRIEEALRTSEERLRLVTENMSDLVGLHESDCSFLYVTSSSEALLGYRPEELIGRDPYDLMHPDDRERVHQHIHGSLPQVPTTGVTYRFRHRDGHYIWLETLTKPVLDEAGHIIHLQTTSRNVSDRIEAEQQLKHDALHDSLTGLPNRNCLMARLEQAMRQAQAQPDYQFAVLFLDLDNFKVVNDSLGHLLGDELLITIAQHLRQFIRDTDLAARLGGDEFVILIEDIVGIHEAIAIAERILNGLRTPTAVGDREVFISTSIGIVSSSHHHQRAADLLRDADLAMYHAKHSGRAQYALFNPTLHLQVMQRLHLEQDLRKALKNQEFLLYYQPIVALETLDVVGFEALIRWQHPQRGLVAPTEFIPIAEETGLIVPMGQWILQTACHQLAQWQAQYPQRSLKISVNLSVQQLQNSLLTHLQEALHRSQILPDCLILEITESMLVENIDSTLRLLEHIRNMGIRLSIDDFGTGYSSLSYLNKLPVDTLKIDRAFVSPDDNDARNQVIAESIIALSNLLELGVVAEGIQTPHQLEWLRQLGCKYGQGFLFSAPVPPEQAARFIQAASSISLSQG